MLAHLTARKRGRAVPLRPLLEAAYDRWLRLQKASVRRWLVSGKFRAKAGETALIPGPGGQLEGVLLGLGDGKAGPWCWSGLPAALPKGTYRIDANLDAAAANDAALGWALGSYRFGRYRKGEAPGAVLVWPAAAERGFVEAAAEATFLARDLINTPANDMGPAELAEAARSLAARHRARFRVVVGPELLKRNYPAIHAVGRASPRAPRLIDFTWGKAGRPQVTLVGKGVCFDTGGLDLKTSGYMKLMKKDMGGAAHVLGLASMIMAAALPVRLRVLVPAVENSVSGNAIRPLDVLQTRSGLTVEIGNTDAEGRVILADALAEASSGKPDLLVDFATLTGAARTALGTDLPGFFCNDDRLAEELSRIGSAVSDPLWRLPLWKPYREQIESPVADLNNAPAGPYGGAITAALFLAEFVGSDIPWIHVDLMAWNLKSRPGRPEGGEAQGMRAMFALIKERMSG